MEDFANLLRRQRTEASSHLSELNQHTRPEGLQSANIALPLTMHQSSLVENAHFIGCEIHRSGQFSCWLIFTLQIHTAMPNAYAVQERYTLRDF